MKNSETWAVALIYLGFFGLVGWTVWATGSAWPIWSLILMPTIQVRDKGREEGTGEE